MMTEAAIRPSDSLKHVRYEIRGRLARRAHELERQGYEIISLNIGNPRAFGLRTPETMRLAMIESLADAERSEERRVGKECRSGRPQGQYAKKEQTLRGVSG